MNKPLQIKEKTPKIDGPKRGSRPDPALEHIEPYQEAQAMSHCGQYRDSSPKINPEHSGTWQPIGAVIARLIGGAK